MNAGYAPDVARVPDDGSAQSTADSIYNRAQAEHPSSTHNVKSTACVLLFGSILSGCAVQLHGNQATSGGTTTTTTSSTVVASASGSNARVGFFSGQPVSAGAPGGQVNLSGGGGNIAAVLLVGAVVVEFLNSLGGGVTQVKPLPPDARISHTCSCYGWQPPAAGETREMRDERR